MDGPDINAEDAGSETPLHDGENGTDATEPQSRQPSGPDPHIAQILAARLPGVPNLGDVRAIDWTAVEPVDVLTAGFPVSGHLRRRAARGIENGARSGLWTDIVAGVRVLRPAILVVENVAALRWRHGGLHRVLGDLAEAGYDTAWRSVRAADIGAAHRRERVFLLYLDNLRPGQWIFHSVECCLFRACRTDPAHRM